VRVEANVHDPSDVLTGYALGHFLGSFVNDAFLDRFSHREVGSRPVSMAGVAG